MPSKITLTLGTALAAIAVCCFVESSFAQDALVASLDATENDDRDAEDKDDKDEKSGRRQTRTTSSLSSRFLTRSGDNMSLGLTSVGDAVEADTVVVTGSWFDTYPVPYPALPPVEGTRINAGKKTSFIKPAEFPAFAGNDYREVMATTPGTRKRRAAIANHQLRLSRAEFAAQRVHAGARRWHLPKERAVWFS
jgi:hypothetical protein